MTADQLLAARADTLLNSAEAAAYLNVPLSSLRNQRRVWGLHPSKVGRALQYRKSELDGLLARNREGGPVETDVTDDILRGEVPHEVYQRTG